MCFEFSITCEIPEEYWDLDIIVNNLCEAGCADATPFSGKRGVLLLEFCREANSLEEAKINATKEIQNALEYATIS